MAIDKDGLHPLLVSLGALASRPVWHVAFDGRVRPLNELAVKRGAAEVLALALAHLREGRADLGPGYEVHPMEERDGGGLIAVFKEQRSPLEVALDEAAKLWDLTERQRELLRELVEGGTAHDVAARLRISWHTVRTIQRELLAKSGCESTVEMVGKLLKML